MASASPSTRLAVVEEVGARFSGQASCETRASRLTSAALANGESGLPVMLIRRMPRRLISGSRVTISAVEPEFDSARTMSSLVIMPMSPWLASAGWTKKEVVPVLARVAAILLPICPDLPMPTTTTRPLQLRISSQALMKSASIRGNSSCTASSSRRMVRCAESIRSRVWFMLGKAVGRKKTRIITGKACRAHLCRMQGSAEAVASLNAAPWCYWARCSANAIVRGHFGPLWLARVLASGGGVCQEGLIFKEFR